MPGYSEDTGLAAFFNSLGRQYVGNEEEKRKEAQRLQSKLNDNILEKMQSGQLGMQAPGMAPAFQQPTPNQPPMITPQADKLGQPGGLSEMFAPQINNVNPNPAVPTGNMLPPSPVPVDQYSKVLKSGGAGLVQMKEPLDEREFALKEKTSDEKIQIQKDLDDFRNDNADRSERLKKLEVRAKSADSEGKLMLEDEKNKSYSLSNAKLIYMASKTPENQLALESAQREYDNSMSAVNNKLGLEATRTEDTGLPKGVTEKDVQFTMKKYKMTRKQVLDKLGAK